MEKEHSLNLSYFKQGEDYAAIEKENGKKSNPAANLRIQAAMLRSDADKLEKVANLIEMSQQEQQEKISLKGDTHTIMIKGPTSFLNMLKKQQLID